MAESGHDIFLYASSVIKIYVPHVSFIEIELPDNKSNGLSFFYLHCMRLAFRQHPVQSDWTIVFGETSFLAGHYLSRKSGGRLLYASRNNFVDAWILEHGQKAAKSIKGRLRYLWLRLLERRILKKSDVLVFQNTYDRDMSLSRNTGLNVKTCIIPNNVQVSWFNPGYRGRNKSKVCRRLLFVGSLNLRKGIDVLAESFKQASSMTDSITLTIAGDGPLREELFEFFSANGLQERAVFIGRASNVFKLYLEHDLCIVPSRYDSYPNVVLEALYCGCPVIGSRISGIQAMLQDDPVLYPAGDAVQLAALIKKLCTDSNAYRQIRSLTEDIVSRHDFDWAASFLDCMQNED